MRLFARRVEHPLDGTVQRSNDADAREHRWTVMFCNQQKRPHRGLPFGTMFCLGPITSAVGTNQSLHWALGQVIPPSLGDALQSEEIEKRNENLRLLYVACTRAMELLIMPDFTWSNDASWAKLLDLKLDEAPELNIARLPRTPVTLPVALENQQSAEVFAADQSRLEEASPRIRWIRPSDADPDVVPIQILTESDQGEPLQPSLAVEGGRLRGVILHKLMEELLPVNWTKVSTLQLLEPDYSSSNWLRHRLSAIHRRTKSWRIPPWGPSFRKSSPFGISSRQKCRFTERSEEVQTA
jgi:ATP-dependent exoDNAse (exonuclease V) beta subunit